MKRSSYRSIIILAVVGLFTLSGVVFWRCQKTEESILARQSDLIRLRQELENVRNISASQIELDKLTINENTATQLDILRYLGLENSNLEFTVLSKEDTPVGDTSLAAHNVAFGGVMPYPMAMDLCDRLQNAHKIVFTKITLNAGAAVTSREGGALPDAVELKAEGKIYGINKGN